MKRVLEYVIYFICFPYNLQYHVINDCEAFGKVGPCLKVLMKITFEVITKPSLAITNVIYTFLQYFQVTFIVHFVFR